MNERWLEEQARRRACHLHECEQLSRIWQDHLAGPAGPLPGSTLDAMPTPDGWVGHVQLVPGDQHVNLVHDIVDDIATAYSLPKGAVVIPFHYSSADTAFIWAYKRPSQADHHDRAPHSVYGMNWQGDSTPAGQLTRLERDELRSWTSKYLHTREWMLKGTPAEIEQLTRRYNRMRGAILDALTRASTYDVVSMLIDAGMTRQALPDDLAHLLGWERNRPPTTP